MLATKISAARTAVGLGCALLLSGSVASANGRFPRAQRLIQSSEEPGVIALYGTYGLLVTEDGGTSWHHICESATGTYMGEDPLLEILPGTKIVVRTETALVASQGSWCDFRSILGNGADSIADITRDPANANALVALVGSYDKTAGFTSRLVQTMDAGKTWSSPLNVPPESVARGLTLDLSPAGSRLYVTGLDSTGQGQILVSDDRGQHFTAHALTGSDSSQAPYLAAVSSKNADTLFVRTDGYTDVDGVDTASDSLLVSTDAGATWTTVITRNAKLFGFALSPDEKTLLLGYGDPQISATAVEPSDVGLYSADVATLLADLAHGESAFSKIFTPSVTCLRWTEHGLFACTLASETGFEVGRAADAGFTTSNPSPFAPLLHLSDLSPLPCGEGTSAYGCYTDPAYGFLGVCAVVGASCDVMPPAPGTVSGVYTGTAGTSSSVGGTSGAGGAPLMSEPGAGGATTSPPGAGGASPSVVASGAPNAGTAAASPSGGLEPSASCGCRTGGRDGSAGAAAALLSLLVLGARRRRRRLP